ncbi:GntR family transcriptional regulator [Microbacterium sp. NPDC056234]|uniref:GntR family transcriptional regulator n=1 Tax=Microbacterium sp. NPDC056234 TaxID=3345757 RepID=UPI0035D6F782
MTGAVSAELESVRVTRLLREDIVLGRRAPGSRLVERDIAAELNVSRLPVREAIRSLVVEGIVTTRPRTWAVVKEFTAQDVQDVAEVREAFETLTFQLAAQRHDAAGLARLREALDREAASARRGDFDAGRLAAGDFHTCAADLTGNEMLREMLQVFSTRLRWLFGQHEDLDEMVIEHEVLFDAVAARDVELLGVLVPRHLARGRALAERRLRERTESAV